MGEVGVRIDLAEKLNRLFDTRPGITNDQVAREIEARFGVSITPQYIGQLRAGRKSNPTIRQVKVLAEYFGTSAWYLVDSDGAEDIWEQVLVTRVLRDTALRGVVMRLDGLSAPALANIAAIVEHALSIAGRDGSRSAADGNVEKVP